MIFSLFYSYSLIIIPLLSIALLLSGYCLKIPYINVSAPLGRTLYFCFNSLSIGMFWIAFSVLQAMSTYMQADESLWQSLLVVYVLGIGAIIIFFLGGMRRLAAIGTIPLWLYPVAIILGVVMSVFIPVTIEILGIFHLYLLFAPSK